MTTSNERSVEFSAGEYIVYPAHGVGRVRCKERTQVAGFDLETYVIEFEKERLTLRVPLAKVGGIGVRKLASPEHMRKALNVLRGRARIKRVMWSRRAQEYEAKINSGEIIAIAEVVRDLYRAPTQADPSYSERQIYEAARARLAREVGAVEQLDEGQAVTRIEAVLAEAIAANTRTAAANAYDASVGVTTKPATAANDSGEVAA